MDNTAAARPADQAEQAAETVVEQPVADTLGRRIRRNGWALVETLLAAYASLAVLILSGLLVVVNVVDLCANHLCRLTDHTTARLVGLGRPGPNRLCRSMYDPENPGVIYPHEDPDGDPVELWIGRWEEECKRADEAEARADEAEDRLAAAEAALELLNTAANLPAIRAEQRAALIFGATRTGKNPHPDPAAGTPAGSDTREENDQ